MQVAQYSNEYDHNQRRWSGSHGGGDRGQYRGNEAGGYYAPPFQGGNHIGNRPDSRSGRGEGRERGEKKEHGVEKSLGATIVGGALGVGLISIAEMYTC